VVAAFVVFRLSPNRSVGDSFYSTLLSWSVMTTGSVHLESFLGDATAMRRMPGFVAEWGRPYQIEPTINGHLMYWYPPAPSFLAVPLVAGAAAFGMTPLGPDGRYDPVRDIVLHGWLGPAGAAAIVGVLFLIAAELLPLPAAAVVTVVAALGSPIWSTLSRGMSSNTWHVLLLSLAALEMLRAAHREREIHGARLATLVALAYLSRPATSITIACVTVWMLLRYPRRFVAYAVTGAAWAALFFAYSFVQFGVPLPSYYRLAARLSPEWIWPSAMGILFSPSRGLLVYSPIVAWVAWILARYWRALRYPDLAIVACACVGGTFLATTTWRVWWGGHSYGPRLAADFIPWLVLIAVLALEARRRVIAAPASSAPSRRRLELALGVMLGIASATLHAPGALQVETMLWNERLGPEDYEPPLLWEWQYPQFLAAYRMPPRFLGPLPASVLPPPKD
jgi:hypothetical protein